MYMGNKNRAGFLNDENNKLYFTMKRFLLLGIPLFLLAFVFVEEPNEYRTIENKSITAGEVIKYNAHYGFVSTAEGTVTIDKNIEMINDRPCYKVDLYGRTVKFFDILYKVRDHWGTYVDTSAIVSQKFYRYIKQGKYRKNEIIEFDHSSDTARVHKLDKKTKKLIEVVPFKVPNNVQDMLSGYIYLRTVDFTSLEKNDTISIPGFYDDEIYSFRMRYLGKEEIKTKFGRINALKIAPVMPDNSVFDGENSILAWLSDDEFKIPLKIKAKMFVGSMEVDVKEVSGFGGRFGPE